MGLFKPYSISTGDYGNIALSNEVSMCAYQVAIVLFTPNGKVEIDQVSLSVSPPR